MKYKKNIDGKICRDMLRTVERITVIDRIARLLDCEIFKKSNSNVFYTQGIGIRRDYDAFNLDLMDKNALNCSICFEL